ncbi:MAG: hypothetical protein PVJ66_09270 [Gammaproteobacteria bacterium]
MTRGICAFFTPGISHIAVIGIKLDPGCRSRTIRPAMLADGT